MIYMLFKYLQYLEMMLGGEHADFILSFIQSLTWNKT